MLDVFISNSRIAEQQKSAMILSQYCSGVDAFDALQLPVVQLISAWELD